MTTPHIEAKKGEIAEIVLMPGDPLRAKFIADNYLDNPVIFNTVRNMLGYTGYYQGTRVSVMGSGMGMPSIGIYAYELYKFYDVKIIIRIGSCGAYHPALNLYDLILVDQSYSESTFAYELSNYPEKVTKASLNLNNKIEESAKKLDINITRGNIMSSDVFYTDLKPGEIVPPQYNYLAVEMEAFALFHIANVLNKEAACLLSVVDIIATGEKISALERERSLGQAIKLALETVKDISKERYHDHTTY
ncbi:MAG: purine-nucleoside phosphorylase [Bacilli bacterium]|jgi:purine-nucleoside phosphorylase|nr:purine-nucleoside phosphorylase [Bacilli bacterium]